MAFNMRFQATYGGAWTTVDVTESKVHEMRLEVLDNAPKTLTWKMAAPQHESPIPSGSFVQVWFDDGDYEGTTFSSSYPTFEGFCRSSPGNESNVVEYTAYDPTSKAASDITVMDEGWTTSGGSIVIEDSAVPRTVYNCFNDRDSDWNISKVNPFVGPNNETNRFYVSEMIADILNEAVLPLQYYYAAPGSLAAPYVAADLDVTALQWIPQDKLSIQNESVRQAIVRLLTNYAPAYKTQFRCGDRKWRFYNAALGTQRTYTLNATDLDDLVLDFWIDKSLEGRCTAVELYGPKNFGLTIFSTEDGSLTPDEDTKQEIDNWNSLLDYEYGYCTFQIADAYANDRAGSRTLAQHYWAPIPVFATELTAPGGGGWRWTYQLVPTRAPTLQASWDDGETWVTMWHPWWDFREGTVTTGIGNPIYLYKKGEGDVQKFFAPDHYRIVYAPYSSPLKVRYPTSGFSGSAYDDENVQAVFRQYHEMLAVGYETNYYYETASGTQTIGSYVTITERVNQYKKLAEAIHAQRSNTVWVGGLVLDGLKWDMLNLNRRVNLTGRTANGGSLTTGWEEIGAIVTRVSYDFNQETTTIIFSSDQLEVMGYPVELLMEQLKIKALERRSVWQQQLHWRWVENSNSWRNSGFNQLSGVTVTENVFYVDPDLYPRELWDDGIRDGVYLADTGTIPDYWNSEFWTQGYSGGGMGWGPIHAGAMPMSQPMKWEW